MRQISGQVVDRVILQCKNYLDCGHFGLIVRYFRTKLIPFQRYLLENALNEYFRNFICIRETLVIYARTREKSKLQICIIYLYFIKKFIMSVRILVRRK